MPNVDGVMGVDRRLRLSRAQRAFIDLRPRGPAGNDAAFAGIPRRDAAMYPAPLALAQQRLRFLERLHSDRAVYNRFRAIHLIGRLDVDALERGLQSDPRRRRAAATLFAQRCRRRQLRGARGA
jgi:hypothetical protein